MFSKKIKKAGAMALAAASVVTMSPSVANATSYTGLNISNGDNHQETASATFTVTEEILNNMNVGLVVSIPRDFALTYDSSNRAFTGSEILTCYGITGGTKSVRVEINEESNSYGTIRDSANKEYKLESWNMYDVELSKNLWTPEELRANYETFADEMSYTNMTNATLSITLSSSNFMPKSCGDYRVYVPLKISKE